MKKTFTFHTIRLRLTVLVSVLLFGVFAFYILAHQLFLPKYYQHEKCKRLENMYTSVYENLNRLYGNNKEKDQVKTSTSQPSSEAKNNFDDILGKEQEEDAGEESNNSYFGDFFRQSEEYDEEEEADTTSDGVSQETIELAIEKLGADNDIDIYVMDWQRVYQSGQWIYYAQFLYPAYDQDGKNSRAQNIILQQIGENYAAYYGLESIGRPNLVNNEGSLIYTDRSERYTIRKTRDKRLDSEYLDLVGTIAIEESNYSIYMRSNYESIQESIKLSSRFLLYAAIVAIVLGILMMTFISRGFTRPIVEVSQIAKEMSELRFETKYQGDRVDEIGDLGHSVNVLSEKLEQTISELKAANNELQNDIEKKEQIDDMRKEFLSNVTHELKTPIALIQGYAEGLQDNINDDEESRQFYCEVIIDEANKMNNMVKKLLNLNQLEFGTNQVEFERFDLAQVVQSVINSNQILINQKQVHLQFEVSEPVYVWADEFMVQEVVTNYISNALNHVDGERIIQVRMDILDGKVRTSVRNTGQTIPEEDIDKVWVKFYKVDKARTREYGGSGIGLSIVHAIMHSMHQDFGVHNLEDGVEFWFDLERNSSAGS